MTQRYDWSDLRELYLEQRLSSHKIGRKKGCDHSIVLDHLRRQGVPIRSRSEATPSKAEWSDLEDLYLNRKLSITKIAKLKGCCSATVFQHLKKRNIPSRAREGKYDWSDLRELYIDKKLSTNEIAKIKRCTRCTVSRNLDEIGIPRRTQLEAYQLARPKLKYPHGKGPKSTRWKGGRKRKGNYIQVYKPDHPLRGKDGYVFEHRLIMEEKVGRYLLPSEKVHHINGIKDDNRSENLELLSPSNHSLRTLFCQNCELKKEIRLLRWELRELRKTLQPNLWPGGDNDQGA